MRIARCAHGAVAAQAGHAHRCTRAKNGELQ
jgi:hypothetical protein